MVNFFKNKMKEEDILREEENYRNCILFSSLMDGDVETSLSLIDEEGRDFNAQDKVSDSISFARIYIIHLLLLLSYCI